MSIRRLLLGALVVGSLGGVACVTEADASDELAQVASTEAQPPGAGSFCGGFAAISCPEGLVCVDDPNDTCDPNQGGADCGGICVREKKPPKPRCDYNDPTLSYVSRDPNECAAILFVCADGATPFFNECGCGCQQTGSSCRYDDPNRRYVSRDPEQCATLRFVCESGESAFFDSCGCGCETTPTP